MIIIKEILHFVLCGLQLLASLIQKFLLFFFTYHNSDEANTKQAATAWLTRDTPETARAP